MSKHFLPPLLLLFVLTACTPAPDPGAQCLNSFKAELKDPESGKVLSFEPPVLTYTATNSYGARMQSKAYCAKVGDKWRRDLWAEELAILDLTTKKLKVFTICKKAGVKAEACAGGSRTLMLAAISQTQVDVAALKKEAATELGF